jgi:membrane-bound lytic murein transglycosylase D
MPRTAVRLGGAAIAGALWLAASAARADSRSGSTGKAASTRAHEGRGTAKGSSRKSDSAARRAIAGGSTADEASAGFESSELRALREAERELFAQPAAPAAGAGWPSDLPQVLSQDSPRVFASGLPPAAPTVPPPPAERGGDWLAKLELPDLPIRWDERVVRYLEFFRDDPRGHATFANLYRHSGRWQAMMRRVLRTRSLPEDLIWVAMIESGFDPVARSSAGAAGVWQFMPETAKIYGLTVDHWLDERLSTPTETDAAADLLADLHRRFGSWELALAGYSMGYAGLASVVRRFNTNDFWSLARIEGTLPWETTLYVPKILASAVVAHNLAAFGFADVTVDSPVETDEVTVPPGTPLSIVAQAVGSTTKDLEGYNPQLRASRTPPAGEGEGAYTVRVPAGKGGVASQMLGKTRRDPPALERYVVRFGETLEQIAVAHRTTAQKLVELNGIAPGEIIRGGTVLLVPATDAASATPATPAAPAAPATKEPAAPPVKESVIVPADIFVYPDYRRVFYRVRVGDTLKEVAAALHVSVGDLDRWNDIDPAARLEEGMTLQAFVPPDADLSHVVVIPEAEVRVLAVGSDEFFASLERDRGLRRITVAAREGDTLEAIGKRYEISAKTMERVNRRGRAEALKAGEKIVVYVPNGMAAAASGANGGGRGGS